MSSRATTKAARLLPFLVYFLFASQVAEAGPNDPNRLSNGGVSNGRGETEGRVPSSGLQRSSSQRFAGSYAKIRTMLAVAAAKRDAEGADSSYTPPAAGTLPAPAARTRTSGPTGVVRSNSLATGNAVTANWRNFPRPAARRGVEPAAAEPDSENKSTTSWTNTGARRERKNSNCSNCSSLDQDSDGLFTPFRPQNLRPAQPIEVDWQPSALRAPNAQLEPQTPRVVGFGPDLRFARQRVLPTTSYEVGAASPLPQHGPTPTARARARSQSRASSPTGSLSPPLKAASFASDLRVQGTLRRPLPKPLAASRWPPAK